MVRIYFVLWNNTDEVVVLFLHKKHFIFAEFLVIYLLISPHKVSDKSYYFHKEKATVSLTQGQCALFMVSGVYVSIIASALEHN